MTYHLLIVVEANDTNILAILICNQHKFEGMHIWMEVGNFANNSLRFIDMSLLVEHLGEELSKSIPAFHAFTGCDYSLAFVGKGKIRPFELLAKDPEYQNAFSRIETEDIDEDLINVIQSYVCKLAWKPKKNSDSILPRHAEGIFKAFQHVRRIQKVCIQKVF